MSHSKVWDFWAPKYKKLWVQKYSLGPTREVLIERLTDLYRNKKVTSIMDIGCGDGDLISEIHKNIGVGQSYGLDYSKKMVEIAAAQNPKTQFECVDIHDYPMGKEFQILTCTHSFPYYKDQKRVIDQFARMIEDDGKLFVAFASTNTLYDHMCMSLVKLTTGFAKYPSVSDFKALTDHDFNLVKKTLIKKKWYMPSIYLFELELKNEECTAD